MPGPTLEEILASFLDSTGRASSTEFERLLQDHPNQVEDLRRLWDS